MKYRVITTKGAFIVNAPTEAKAATYIRREGHTVIEVLTMGYKPPRRPS